MKKTKKSRINTHTEHKQTTPKHTHTEPKTDTKNTLRHKKQQRTIFFYYTKPQKQRIIKTYSREHMNVVCAARKTCAAGYIDCCEFGCGMLLEAIALS